jgi:F0F1-type ATP synthase delta subunit
MKQSRTTLSKIIADRTLKAGASKNLAKELAAYLLQERRVGELGSILRDVQQDWASAGIVEVIARCAFPIPASVEKQIKDEVGRVYPQAKQINIDKVIDPEVIGGVRLELPNQQLDLTIEQKLDRFKQLTLAGKD